MSLLVGVVIGYGSDSLSVAALVSSIWTAAWLILASGGTRQDRAVLALRHKGTPHPVLAWYIQEAARAFGGAFLVAAAVVVVRGL